MANTPQVPLSASIVSSMVELNTLHNARTGRPTDATGVFAAQPFASPKYARHRSDRKHEFEDTMARMFIKVAPDVYKKFIASIDDADTRLIAEVLAGDEVSQGGNGYLDFLMQSANHSFEEKFQVAETLSDNYVAFFFGHAPPIFQYQGTLLNTYQNDWTMSMFRIFRDLARGTQLARRNLILRLRYDSMIVSGAMINFNWSLVAGQEMATSFSFGLLVKSIHVIYGGISRPTKYERGDKFTPDGFQLVDPGAGNADAAQTYIGSPPGMPAGVYSEEHLSFGSSETDASGTTYTEPPQFVKDFDVR